MMEKEKAATEARLWLTAKVSTLSPCARRALGWSMLLVTLLGPLFWACWGPMTSWIAAKATSQQADSAREQTDVARDALALQKQEHAARFTSEVYLDVNKHRNRFWLRPRGTDVRLASVQLFCPRPICGVFRYAWSPSELEEGVELKPFVDDIRRWLLARQETYAGRYVFPVVVITATANKEGHPDVIQYFMEVYFDGAVTHEFQLGPLLAPEQLPIDLFPDRIPLYAYLENAWWMALHSSFVVKCNRGCPRLNAVPAR